MNLLKRLAVVVALSCTLISLTGCALFLVGAGAAIGAGSVAYVSGELRGAEEASMDRAWNAATTAMEQLEFKVTKSQKDALAGEITARRADDTRIVVRLRKQTDRITEIRVRVGVFGDEALSRVIYDKIKSNI